MTSDQYLASDIEYPVTLTMDIPGRLVAFPSDGFLAHGARRNRRLLIFVHGMGSNFYRSRLKKEFLRTGPDSGFDVLSFNNSGCEQNTACERFRDCLEDIDSAVGFGRSLGYREFILAGHSTGSQKITYWQAIRQDRRVKALVLLATGDDYAILRRDLGRRFDGLVKLARRMVARGKGGGILPTKTYEPFAARRFLSIADPRELEAGLFDFSGRLSHFRRIRCPVLALFAGADEFGTLPLSRVEEVLGEATRSSRFTFRAVRGADHGFHGRERAVSRIVFDWLGR